MNGTICFSVRFCDNSLLVLKMRFQLSVRIKRIAIAKCDLFFDYSDTKEILFYYFCDTKLCAKHKKKTLEFHLYCRDHVCKVSKWSLVDRFHREFRFLLK